MVRPPVASPGEADRHAPREAAHYTVRHAAVEASHRAHTMGRPPKAPSPWEAAGHATLRSGA